MASNNKNATEEDSDIRILKKYPNRRIYDTHESAYINLDDIRKMIIDDINFKVVDSKSIGAILVVKGATWAFAIGILLTFLIYGKDFFKGENEKIFTKDINKD